MLRFLDPDGNITGSSSIIPGLNWDPINVKIRPQDIENPKTQTKLVPVRTIFKYVEQKVTDRMRELRRLTKPTMHEELEMESLDQALFLFEELEQRDWLERESTQWMNFKITFNGYDESSVSVHDVLTQMSDQLRNLSGYTEGIGYLSEVIDLLKTYTCLMKEKSIIYHYSGAPLFI